MRCLVTGANGMLGTALCPLLAKNDHEVFLTDINCSSANMIYLDVRDFNGVRDYINNNNVNPDIIFHLAAETDVDKCEIDVDHAYRMNTIGTENIALICQERDIPMVYISTCGVFDGKKPEPYNEFDEPNPISVYTKTKYEGEKIVRNLLTRYFIFRAGWMIGGGKRDKKFVAKITEQIRTKNEIVVVNDKIGSPTFTKDFSQCIIKIINSGRYGLYHVTNKGWASRYDIACKIVEFLGRREVNVKPISSALFPLAAPRPRSEAVDSYKLKLLGINVRPWEDALKEYLSELVEEQK